MIRNFITFLSLILWGGGMIEDWSAVWSHLKTTFHLTISMRGQRATGKSQRNNYHHGSCRPSLTGKTMSVFLMFTKGMHWNVKNRWVRSSLNLWSFVLQWNSLESNFSADDLMGTLITPWHRDHDIHWNRSQLVPIEFKSVQVTWNKLWNHWVIYFYFGYIPHYIPVALWQYQRLVYTSKTFADITHY